MMEEKIMYVKQRAEARSQHWYTMELAHSFDPK